MNLEEFSAWKAREYERAHDFPDPDPSAPSSSELQDFYPEWDFSGLYTTSLEPHTPLWVQLPFYDRINVGINLRLSSIDEFKNTYNATPEELLDLYKTGHVNLRLLYPLSEIEPAEFYEPLISSDLPSSMRDWAFSEKLLGRSEFNSLENSFKNLTAYRKISNPLDQVGESTDRAQQTMWAVYVQLNALGYDRHVEYFESIVLKNKKRARAWMEVCRQFLIGPVHYSLGGVHSVSPRNPVVGRNADGETLPTEVGEVLVDKLDLVNKDLTLEATSIDEALSVYDNYQQARDALWWLKSAVESENPDDIQEAREEASKIIDQATNTHENMLKAFRLLGTAGTGAVGLTQPYVGILAALGYTITESATGNIISESLAKEAERKLLDQHLVSIIGLWKDSNRE